jgi:hypothetical protein
MQASVQPSAARPNPSRARTGTGTGDQTRSALLAAAAAPLMLACAAWSQVPGPPPRLPAAAARTTPAPHPGQPLAGQSLPPAQPTQIQSQIPLQIQTQSQAAAFQPAAASAPRASRARVEFAGDQLTIAAENSSLDEILGEIARLTGMKITGGVNDERVYGKYGPDSAQVVLSELLDGTGTNMLLLETPRHTLAELVLSPRNGGPTPPSPSFSRDDERNEENLPPGLAGRRREFPPGGRHPRFDEPSQENRMPEPPQGAPAPPSNGETATPQGDAAQQSPNGVKTPQQIYEELVKQQAQQQQAPTTTP